MWIADIIEKEYWWLNKQEKISKLKNNLSKLEELEQLKKEWMKDLIDNNNLWKQDNNI